MAKNRVPVSLRKPPPADAEAFVQKAEPQPQKASRELARAPEPQLVTTRAGERREVVVYLPEDVARKLSIRCMEIDRDMSNVVAEAVRRDLDGPAPPEPITIPPMAEVVDRAKDQLRTFLKTRPWSKLPFAFSLAGRVAAGGGRPGLFCSRA